MRGFSLIELLMVIALSGVLLSLGLFLSLDVYRGTLARSERDVLVSALTAARSRALDNAYQSGYGLCYAAPDFILFKGSAYPAGASDNQRIAGDASASVSSAGGFFTCGSGTGVLFAQLSGKSATNGVITISEPGHADETVTVNSEGTIVW